jgi:hypothetical protein
MSNNDQQTTQAEHVPELFPLPNEGALRLAENNRYVFGWGAESKRKRAEFELSFSTPAGGSVNNRWPLTNDGWQTAWSFMQSKYPQLARATADACEEHRVRRRELERGPEYRRDLEAEGRLGFLGEPRSAPT